MTWVEKQGKAAASGHRGQGLGEPPREPGAGTMGEEEAYLSQGITFSA